MKNRNSILSDLILILVVLIIAVPIFTMLIWIFTERWAWPDLYPQVFSLRAVMEVVSRNGQLLKVISSSMLISFAVAALSVVIGIMTARAMVYYEFKGKSIVYFFATLPLMIPVTVFAMGAHIIFIRLGLNSTVFGVIIAHLICSLPYAIHLISDGTEALGYRLEEQARVLGAKEFYAFRKVTLPLLMPVILSAFSMSYIVSFSQYFLTLLVGSGKVKTFTIIMVPYLQSGERNIASVYSAVFLGVTMIVLLLAELLTGKFSKGTKDSYYS